MADRSFHSRFKDLTGLRYGKLLVKGISHRLRNRQGDVRVFWLCICDCGNEAAVGSSNLISGTTLSCGCRRLSNLANRTHGACAGGTETPEYRIWQGMKKRCLNPRNIGYPNYGGRGIKVCDRWMSFANFNADMGQRPTPKHQLDRIDPNGDYEPKNCRWAMGETQANNTRRNVFIEVNGHRMTVSQAARMHNLRESMVRKRLYRGWSVSVALSTPPGLNPA